jgi:hypothetical protein
MPSTHSEYFECIEYNCELAYELDNAHLARKESIQLRHSEDYFYATLTAQSDSVPNQQISSLESCTLHIAPHGSVAITNLQIIYYFIKGRKLQQLISQVGLKCCYTRFSTKLPGVGYFSSCFQFLFYSTAVGSKQVKSLSAVVCYYSLL